MTLATASTNWRWTHAGSNVMRWSNGFQPLDDFCLVHDPWSTRTVKGKSAGVRKDSLVQLQTGRLRTDQIPLVGEQENQDLLVTGDRNSGRRENNSWVGSSNINALRWGKSWLCLPNYYLFVSPCGFIWRCCHSRSWLAALAVQPFPRFVHWLSVTSAALVPWKFSLLCCPYFLQLPSQTCHFETQNPARTRKERNCRLADPHLVFCSLRTPIISTRVTHLPITTPATTRYLRTLVVIPFCLSTILAPPFYEYHSPGLIFVSSPLLIFKIPLIHSNVDQGHSLRCSQMVPIPAISTCNASVTGV